MLRAKRDDNPVVLRPLRPLKLADAEGTISLTWLDLGSVSTGYSDKPVAMAIKIKHAGFNLTGRRKDIMKRIRHNDLTHYFLRDHRTLPRAYLRKCEKFFQSIQDRLITKKDAAFLFKLQATSRKPQAPSRKLDSWPE